MMDVYKSEITCSMRELKNVTLVELRECKTGKEFLDKDEYLSEDGAKVIVYNTSHTDKKFGTEMSRLGFNKVLTYPGNGARTIHTWVGKVSDIRKVK